MLKIKDLSIAVMTLIVGIVLMWVVFWNYQNYKLDKIQEIVEKSENKNITIQF